MVNDSQEQADFESSVLVERLAEEYLDRLRNGRHPRVSEYTDEHPELADEIRDVFRTLAMLEDLAPDHQEAADDLAMLGSREVPSQLGEYRVIRELGRGGMGVVYEAEHSTMRRNVALKVLHKRAQKSDHGLQRFLREARAAGRLHHTNIVPVFEVGEDDGTSFYAMQCIRGQNLDLVIDDLKRLQNPDIAQPKLPSETQNAARCLLSGVYEAATSQSENLDSNVGQESPSATTKTGDTTETMSEIVIPNSSELSNVGEEKEGYFRRVARIGLQIADALGYAHEHGILHRDIKPSNLILDTEGTVWITDFGLARSEGDDLTHTGDIVGTLRYMAPERFRGAADEKSDIYSLGLTIYELCTLRHAFDRSDRAELIQQVTHQVPIRPRRLNPNIPLDLETIVLKCIDREPSVRYAAASAVENDLRLFLADRPILARRSSLWEQSWRWCRRNPMVASMVSCIALLLAVVSIGALAFAFTAQQHADDLKLETRRARAAEGDARTAELQSRLSLYKSHIALARASRTSRERGRRHASLDAIHSAVRLLPNLGFDTASVERDRVMLRSAAIAAMPLVDVQEHKVWEEGEGAGRVTAISPDGKLMLWPRGATALIVTGIDGPERAEIACGLVRKASFDSTSSYVAATYETRAGTQTSLRTGIWDLKTKQKIADVKQAGDFAFRPDGRAIAIGDSGGVTLFDLADGTPLSSISLDAKPYLIVYQSTRVLAVATKASVRLFDPTGEQVEEIEFPATITSIDITPQGSLAVGCNDTHLYVRHTGSQKISKLEGHTGNVVRTFFSDDGRLIASEAWGGTRFIFDAYSGEKLLNLGGVYLSRGSLSNGNPWVGFAEHEHRKGLLKVSKGGPFRVLHSAQARARWGISVHPRYQSIVALSGEDVEIWDTEQEILLTTIRLDKAAECRFSPDGKTLFVTNSGGKPSEMIDIDIHPGEGVGWAVEVGNSEPIPGLEMSQPNTITQHLATSKDGNIMAVLSQQRSAFVRDLTSDEPAVKLSPHPGAARIDVTPDGDFVATSPWHGNGIRIWDRRTGELEVELAADESGANIHFSPNGKWLVSSSRQQDSVFDTETWTQRVISDGVADGATMRVACAPNSQYAVVPYSASQFRLIDLATARTIAVLESPTRQQGIPVFSPSGDRLFFAVSEGIHVWNLKQLRENLAEMELDW